MEPISKMFLATLEWSKGQPFANVMSLLQLAAIIGAAYFAMNVLIPAERKAILEGMERQETHHSEQLDRMATSFEKALDRLSRYQGP